MNIGVIKFSIRLPTNQSLKGKRKIVKSLCQRLKNNFEVAVAEVDLNDNLKMGVIGICMVSNDNHMIQKVISQILNFIQEQMGEFILVDFNQEILSGF